MVTEERVGEELMVRLRGGDGGGSVRNNTLISQYQFVQASVVQIFSEYIIIINSPTRIDFEIFGYNI